MRIPARTPNNYWRNTAILIGLVVLASFLIPGGRNLTVLVWVISSWAVSIWLFINFRAIRVLVVCAIVVITLALLIFRSALDNLFILGY